MVQQVTVSNLPACLNPKNLGFCSVLQGTWDSTINKVTHAKATPLECVHDEDINNFRVRVLSMPATYAIMVGPNGSSYTSTATLSGNEVTFTLPGVVNTVETWTLTLYDPGNSASPTDSLVVKLKRVTP
jgi:hypothetical protein